ncbi:cytochrome P450 family [Rhizoctonia solani]|uniref:Cytochrome P450 family n=1 Tax=Rhizoctonia solani TaxID=456999 RepID=A0A8H7H1G2_9AGAM|nr:cytochrome P450 family [Rhizoctonia solani]
MERTDFWVNAFPILASVPDWVPGTGWKRTAREWREQKVKAINTPYEWTKQQISNCLIQSYIQAKGDFEHSFLGCLLDDNESTGESCTAKQEKELKELCYTLFVGGTNTTGTALLSFVAAMVAHPEAQIKAQAEIDSVIGYATRLPTLADAGQLPYVQQLILEVIRWLPVAPTGGPPHQCSQDDVYQGYDIQKGTIVMVNLWALSRDKTVYNSPEVFDPERFADSNVTALPNFGWGRRKCPGNHFAEASLFLFISSMLTTFTFSRKVDPDGREVTPKIEGDYNSLALILKPFEFELSPRSEEHKQLVIDNMPKD